MNDLTELAVKGIMIPLLFLLLALLLRLRALTDIRKLAAEQITRYRK